MALARQAYGWLMLGYLAVLPIAETIALRHLLMALLLGLLLFVSVQKRRQCNLQNARWLLRHFGLLVLWCGFLLAYPLSAMEPDVAWKSLQSEWLMAIAAWVLGVGGALWLRDKGPSLVALGHASMVLVAIHLGLTLLAWSGLLGNNPPSVLSWPEIGKALHARLFLDEAWHWQPFPWRFQGFDPMHGNLGYTATQAVALMLAVLMGAWLRGMGRSMAYVGLAVALCFASVVVAMSRGAVLYSVLVLVVGAVVYRWRLSRDKGGAAKTSKERGGVASLGAKVLGSLLLVILLTTAWMSVQKDPRWGQMYDKVTASWMVDRPIEFLCEGVTPALESRIRQRFSNLPGKHLDAVMDGLRGDGGRVLAMRAGMALVIEHPWGLDGSRHSFKKLMWQACGYPPALDFAHSHQGWIDLLLALGWAGGALYFALLAYLVGYGWKNLGSQNAQPWALALLLLAMFWLLRGFTDAVYREHTLLMQALVLGYLWGRIVLLTTSQPPLASARDGP